MLKWILLCLCAFSCFALAKPPEFYRELRAHFEFMTRTKEPEARESIILLRGLAFTSTRQNEIVKAVNQVLREADELSAIGNQTRAMDRIVEAIYLIELNERPLPKDAVKRFHYESGLRFLRSSFQVHNQDAAVRVRKCAVEELEFAVQPTKLQK